jgi:type IV secretory pathway TraG/TraD family ATPase VirD4
LKELHPKTYESFINNCSCLWLDAQDVTGSEYLSKMLGVTEFRWWGRSIATVVREGRYEAQITSPYQQTAVPLARPEEIRGKRSDVGILFLKGVRHPILALRKPYYETSLRFRAKPNPFYSKPSLLRRLLGR